MQTAMDDSYVTYHLYCCRCGWDWWSENAFPDKCPHCGKDPWRLEEEKTEQ